MAANPTFAATPRAASATLATANTARDGTGTVVTVLTAGASGSKIEEITVIATGTVTAGMVRLFLHDGANYFLWSEVAVTAATPSASVKCFTNTTYWDNLILPNGWSLRATTHNAEGFKVHAFGGDF